MKYKMIGHVFFDGLACPIREDVVVSGYDEALELLKTIGYEHYMFSLVPVREE